MPYYYLRGKRDLSLAAEHPSPKYLYIRGRERVGCPQTLVPSRFQSWYRQRFTMSDTKPSSVTDQSAKDEKRQSRPGQSWKTDPSETHVLPRNNLPVGACDLIPQPCTFH
jgi:hypothetical protein